MTLMSTSFQLVTQSLFMQVFLATKLKPSPSFPVFFFFFGGGRWVHCSARIFVRLSVEGNISHDKDVRSGTGEVVLNRHGIWFFK